MAVVARRPEQASADKVAEWLRSSRTFGRAPTGRVPPLAEQMSDRQRMEAELRNKLQVRVVVGEVVLVLVCVEAATAAGAAAGGGGGGSDGGMLLLFIVLV